MKMNIASAKKFIDAWQININDAIYIEIVKSMSQVANNVNYVLLIKKKKRCTLFKFSNRFKRSTLTAFICFNQNWWRRWWWLEMIWLNEWKFVRCSIWEQTSSQNFYKKTSYVALSVLSRQ